MVASFLNRASEESITTMPEISLENQRQHSCSEDDSKNDLNTDNSHEDKYNEAGDNTIRVDGKIKKEVVNDTENDKNEAIDFSGDSSCISSGQSLMNAARCSESMPSSDSNKENLNSNSLSQSSVEFNPSEYVVTGEHDCDEYDKTDLIPLPQLLKIHMNQLVSGFEFGEATKRRAQENMKSARDKKMNENRKSGEICEDLEEKNEPSCSKTLSENDHKTPHSHKRQRLAESKISITVSDKDFSKGSRKIPDCLVDHPDCVEVWVYMIYKEEAALKLRNPRLFNDFKSVTPRMRAILLDWLMEVAAVYHLRRVTYYLSVDYFDRFLSIRPDIPKSLLQLVGITCLYIAAKVEEIYPPNLSEFSYVCDGACKSKEMVSCELLILNSLGWEVILTTPSDWLNLYMQLHFKSKDVVRTALNLDFNKDFIFPQYSAYQFTRASQLMDLLSLDPGFLKFGYSVIAAAAMYFMYGEEIALSVSGMSWQQLKPCVDYMEAFYKVVKDSPDPRLHSCLGGPHPEETNRSSTRFVNRMKNGPQNENYSFQTHIGSMEYFEKATTYRLSKLKKNCSNSPDHITSREDQFFRKDAETNGNSGKIDKLEETKLNPKPLEEAAAANSLVDDLATLEELTRHDGNENPELEDEQNLMSLDEIFELILSQEELKSNINSD